MEWNKEKSWSVRRIGYKYFYCYNIQMVGEGRVTYREIWCHGWLHRPVTRQLRLNVVIVLDVSAGQFLCSSYRLKLVAWEEKQLTHEKSVSVPTSSWCIYWSVRLYWCHPPALDWCSHFSLRLDSCDFVLEECPLWWEGGSLHQKFATVNYACSQYL